MKIEVNANDIIIKDAKTGQVCKVRTLRTAEDIASYIEETEKDQIKWRVEEIVLDVYDNNQDARAERTQRDRK